MGGNDNVTASLVFVNNLEEQKQGVFKRFRSRSK